MVPTETQYKTYNDELLAIVEAFKTWRHYLEVCKHKVLVLTDHNNFCRFIDTKSLSSKLVHWAYDHSCYYFRINYCQDKANRAADALSQYPQQNAREEKTFHDKKVKITYCLQSLLANVSGLLTSHFPLLYQILICGTTVFARLNKFRSML